MNALFLAFSLYQQTASLVKPPPNREITWTTQVVVSYIVVYAGGYDVELGSTASFSARAFDGLGRAIPNMTFTWSATNGTITGDGQFKADGVLGPYTVTASAQGFTGSAGGSVVAALPPASPLVDMLDTQFPINEGQGVSFRDRVNEIDAVGGSIPFSWGTDPNYGSFINCEGASPITMSLGNVHNPISVFTGPPAPFTEQVIFRPHTGVFSGPQYIGDTDKTARFVFYVNFSPNGSYTDPTHGWVTVGCRDSANTVHLIGFQYNVTNPMPVIRAVKVVDQGRCELWANLHLGAVIEGMEMQASTTSCDLLKTWQTSLPNPVTFYPSGLLSGAMLKGDLFLITLWRKAWSSDVIQGEMYSNALGMYH